MKNEKTDTPALLHDRARRSGVLLAALIALAITPSCVTTTVGGPSGHFDESLSEGPGLDDALAPHGARQTLLEHDKTAGAPSAGELIGAGDRERAIGDYPKAHRSYFRAHLADPENLVPLERIAYLSLRSSPANSAALFRELLDEDPDNASLLVGLAYAELGEGHMDEARLALDRAITIDPESSAAHAAYAVVYDILQEYPHASESNHRATLAVDKANLQILNNQGVSSLLAGDPEGATEFLYRASRLAPNSELAANNLGLALALQGRDQAAYEAFRLHGSRGDALNNLGLACYMRGDSQAARQHFEAALLSGETDDVRVLRNLERLDAPVAAQ